MNDWLREYDKANNGSYLTHGQLIEKCTEFRHLRDVANAFKHVVLDGRKMTDMTGASSVDGKGFAHFLKRFAPGSWAPGVWRDDSLFIDAGADGEKRFTAVIVSVHEMWKKELQARSWLPQEV
jgi:hypothetical protein